MSLGDTIGYLVLGNPISQAVINAAVSVSKGQRISPKNAEVVAVAPIRSLCEIAGSNYHFVRLAGVSGAAAVIMGAYGKQSLASIVDFKEQTEAKAIFETANRFHFLHTFALMAVPLARKPALTGSLLVAGTLFFSGPMYYRALTGDKKFVHVATCGGFCLIAAWLTLIF